MPDEPTPSQQKILDKVEDLLNEHFSGYVLCVRAGDGSDENEFRGVIWNGGACQAVGLIALTHHELLSRCAKS